MFAAQLRNRLTRPEEELEDLLTSNVFGVYLYMPASLGLVQFLRSAENLHGQRIAGVDGVCQTRIDLWPWIPHEGATGTEPDVLIELACTDQSNALLLIEAKFRSLPSTYPDDPSRPTRQLAREMMALRRKAASGNISQYGLVYVTADTAIPKSVLHDAIEELEKRTGDGDSDRFYWTTWRRLPRIIEDITIGNGAHELDEGHAAMLRDLQTIICRLNLTLFEGIDSKGWTLGVDTVWRFDRTPSAFVWSRPSLAHYVFEHQAAKFLWSKICWLNRRTWRFDSHGRR